MINIVFDDSGIKYNIDHVVIFSF